MLHHARQLFVSLIFVAGVIWSAGAAAQITIYQHCNFEGYAVSLPEGEFDLGNLVSRGARNDDISGIRVAPGYIATIYEHAAFRGRAIRLTDSDACLVNDGFNDIISSINVTRQPPANDLDLSQGIWRITVATTGRFLHVDGLGDRLVSTRYQPDDAYTRFRFVPQGDGSYRIRVMATGSFLHADGLGDRLVSTRYQPTDDYTRFYVEPMADGRYRITVRATGRSLHVDGQNDQLLSTRYQVNDGYSQFYLRRVQRRMR